MITKQTFVTKIILEQAPCFCIRSILKPINDIVVYQGLTEVTHILQACVALGNLTFRENQHSYVKCSDLFYIFNNLPNKKYLTDEPNVSPNDRKISKYKPDK